MMRREDFVFCIGFEGTTAIIDGRLMRRHGSSTSRQLAEAGLFKQAVSSAVFNNSVAELEEVLAVFNERTPAPIHSVEELKRTFGVTGVPEGVKKVTVV
jgi:hypothetical protein